MQAVVPTLGKEIARQAKEVSGGPGGKSPWRDAAVGREPLQISEEFFKSEELTHMGKVEVHLSSEDVDKGSKQ